MGGAMQTFKKTRLKRGKLIETLEELVRQLKSGALLFNDHQWTVPEELEAHLELKEKKGRLRGKLKWHWSTLDDYAVANRQQVTHWQTSFKAVKKEMSRTFAALAKAGQQETFPRTELLQQFVDAAEAFQGMADPDWKTAMNEYHDHIENLRRAVRDQRMPDFQHELRDLKARMRACHREFK